MSRPIRFPLTPSRQTLLLLGSFCLGIFVGSGLGFGQDAIVLAEGAAGLFLVGFLFWSAKPVRILSFVLAVGLWGLVWASFYRANLTKDLRSQEGRVSGQVVSDPEERIKDQRMVLEILEPEEFKGKRAWLIVLNEKSFFFGDKLQIEGKFSIPQKFEDFDYPSFLLARHKTPLELRAKQIEILERGEGNLILEKLFQAKRSFKEAIQKAVREPESNLLIGLIIGGQPDMPATLKDKFNRTGTSHIMAVSGYNLAVISVVVFRVLRRISFRTALFLSSLLVVGFVIITGLEAGVVRAGILTGFYFLGKVLGRPTSGIVLLFWVAGIMSLLNPLSLRFDPSFSLSFLAVLGLFYITPIFENWFQKWPAWEPLLPEIKEAITASLGAITATLPLILVLFGRVSLVAPFANLLVVPLVPALMLLGFLIGIGGFLSEGLGGALGLLGFGLGRLVLTIIDWLSRLPFVSLSLPSWISWLYMGVLFLIVMGWIGVRRFYRRVD